MCHRIGHRNQVGFRAKADLPSGPAANDLERMTLTRHRFVESPRGQVIGPFRGTAASSILSRTALKRDVPKSFLGDWAAIVPSASNSTMKNGATM